MLTSIFIFRTWILKFYIISWIYTQFCEGYISQSICCGYAIQITNSRQTWIHVKDSFCSNICNKLPYFIPTWVINEFNLLGVKIRNLKVDFKTGGTWCWVGQWLSRLVSKHQRINKNREDGRFLFIRQHFETKRLIWIKKIINIHYQCSLPDLMASASSLKINFQISDFDT